jgi:hypothetical protein
MAIHTLLGNAGANWITRSWYQAPGKRGSPFPGRSGSVGAATILMVLGTETVVLQTARMSSAYHPAEHSSELTLQSRR